MTKPSHIANNVGWSCELQQRTTDRGLFPETYKLLQGQGVAFGQPYGGNQVGTQAAPWIYHWSKPNVIVAKNGHFLPRNMSSIDNTHDVHKAGNHYHPPHKWRFDITRYQQ